MGNNTLSDYAFAIMQAAICRRALPCTYPDVTRGVVTEALQVPEKPEDYLLQFIRPPQLTAVPVTGGLDSTVLYLRYPTARCYYVDFGQPYAAVEKATLSSLGILYRSIGTRCAVQDYWKHIIPARNFYILSLVAEQLWGGGRILFGAVEGEMPVQGGDKSLAFLEQLNTLLAWLPFQVRVNTPLAQETKTDLVAWWKDTGHSIAMLQGTISCFSGYPGKGKVRHCGACQACLRKWLAFATNDIELPTTNCVRVACAEYIEKYKRVMGEALEKQDFTHYSKRRCEQDLAGIRLLSQ